MLLQSFCEILGFGKKESEIVAPFYSDAVQHFCGVPFFMTHSFVDHYYPLTNGADDVLPKLHAVVDIVADSPAAQLYGVLLHRGIYLSANQRELLFLPLPKKLFGDLAGCYQILIAMSVMPLIEEKFREMGVPEQYVLDAFDWVRGPIELFRAANSVPGYTLTSIYWPRHFIEGKMFRIGRFEYLIHRTPEWMPAVFRHRETREVMALCPSAWSINSDGDRSTEPADKVLETKLEVWDNKVTGTPISPLGFAKVNDRVTLDLNQWEPMASAWDCVPSIHIPSGGGMKLEAAKESLREAVAFFRSYLHIDLRVIVCSSWILNPDWETEMPNSNMAKFMKQLFLTPSYVSSGIDGLYFAFGKSDQRFPENYPADTSLRRAFHSLHAKGKKLKSGAMFLLTEDLEQFGTEYYRQNFL